MTGLPAATFGSTAAFFLNGLAAAHCARMAFIHLANNYKAYKVPQATITTAALALGVAFAFSMTRVPLCCPQPNPADLCAALFFGVWLGWH